jgi:hypothetical protein
MDGKVNLRDETAEKTEGETERIGANGHCTPARDGLPYAAAWRR